MISNHLSRNVSEIKIKARDPDIQIVHKKDTGEIDKLSKNALNSRYQVKYVFDINDCNKQYLKPFIQECLRNENQSQRSRHPASFTLES